MGQTQKNYSFFGTPFLITAKKKSMVYDSVSELEPERELAKGWSWSQNWQKVRAGARIGERLEPEPELAKRWSLRQN